MRRSLVQIGHSRVERATVRLAAVLVAAMVVLAACGDDDSAEPTDGDQSGVVNDGGSDESTSSDAGDAGDDDDDSGDATSDRQLTAAIRVDVDHDTRGGPIVWNDQLWFANDDAALIPIDPSVDVATCEDDNCLVSSFSPRREGLVEAGGRLWFPGRETPVFFEPDAPSYDSSARDTSVLYEDRSVVRGITSNVLSHDSKIWWVDGNSLQSVPDDVDSADPDGYDEGIALPEDRRSEDRQLLATSDTIFVIVTSDGSVTNAADVMIVPVDPATRTAGDALTLAVDRATGYVVDDTLLVVPNDDGASVLIDSDGSVEESTFDSSAGSMASIDGAMWFRRGGGDGASLHRWTPADGESESYGDAQVPTNDSLWTRLEGAFDLGLLDPESGEVAERIAVDDALLADSSIDPTDMDIREIDDAGMIGDTLWVHVSGTNDHWVLLFE